MKLAILRSAAFGPSFLIPGALMAEASDAGCPPSFPVAVALDTAPEEVYPKSGQVRFRGDIEQVHYTSAAGRILILLND